MTESAGSEVGACSCEVQQVVVEVQGAEVRPSHLWDRVDVLGVHGPVLRYHVEVV